MEQTSAAYPVGFLASNMSAAVCWAISGISALSHEPKLMISYAIAAAALSLVAFKNRPYLAEEFRRRAR